MQHTVFPILENAVNEKAFTAWSYANNEIAVSTFYCDEVRLPFSGLSDLKGVFHPVFDLSSLTKPLFLGQVFWERFKDNADEIHASLFDIIDDSSNFGALLKQFFTSVPNLSAAHLLNHQSGLPAWFWFGIGLWSFKDKSEQSRSECHWDSMPPGQLKQRVTDNLTMRCLKNLDNNKIGSETIYSDLNYFLLTRILECLKKKKVSHWEEELNLLNNRSGSQFRHASIGGMKNRVCIPQFSYQIHSQTDSDSFAPDGAELFGPIHDTNANILASLGKKEAVVSGHAGLCGDVLDVSNALNQISKNRVFSQSAPPQRFVQGFDTPSSEHSQAGIPHWPIDPSEKFIGHLGYTGTSFWLRFKNMTLENNDYTNPISELQNKKNAPEKYILLTNRTAQRLHMGSENTPRITVESNLKTGEFKYYISNKKQTLAAITEDDFYSEIYFYKNQKIVWDEARLNKPTDISDLRRKCGKLTWFGFD